jgi:hypothetical protein
MNDRYTNDEAAAARWEDYTTVPEPADFDYDPADDDLYTERDRWGSR